MFRYMYMCLLWLTLCLLYMVYVIRYMYYIYVVINIICISNNVCKSYPGNMWHVLVQNIQHAGDFIFTFWCLLYVCWRSFWKMAATAARGQFGNGSTPKFVHYILIYLCAKIGAFIKKCTIG